MDLNINLDLSDLTPIEVPFEYLGTQYVLKEATGAAAKRYNNERSNRLEYNSEGKVIGTKDMADIVPMLVASCVYTIAGNPIPQSVIETWPDRLLKRLYQTIRKVSFGEGSSAAESQLAQIVDEPGFPVDKETWTKFIEGLDPKRYTDLKIEFKRPTTKE